VSIKHIYRPPLAIGAGIILIIWWVIRTTGVGLACFFWWTAIPWAWKHQCCHQFTHNDCSIWTTGTIMGCIGLFVNLIASHHILAEQPTLFWGIPVAWLWYAWLGTGTASILHCIGRPGREQAELWFLRKRSAWRQARAAKSSAAKNTDRV
jgi:hypothetical protein